jgi:multiple sugar transport system permease protein
MSSGLRTTRARLFVGLALVAMLIWIFIPYYFLFVTSLVPQGTAVRGFEWPDFTTLENYRQILFGANTLWPYLFNSVVVTLSVTLLALLIGVPAGYGLSRLRQFPAAKGLYLSFFVLRMLPPVAFVIPYFLLFSRLNLLDTRRGLVLALRSSTGCRTTWRRRRNSMGPTRYRRLPSSSCRWWPRPWPRLDC